MTNANNGLWAETSEILASRAKAQSLGDSLTALNHQLDSNMQTLYAVSSGSSVMALQEAHGKLRGAVTNVVNSHTDVAQQTTKSAQHFDQVNQDSRSRYAGL